MYRRPPGALTVDDLRRAVAEDIASARAEQRPSPPPASTSPPSSRAPSSMSTSKKLTSLEYL